MRIAELKVNGEIIRITSEGTIDRKGYQYWVRLNGGVHSQGYRKVKIGGKIFGVHRLLARAFLPDWDESLQVDHIDRNRSNNSLSNLRMATQSVNNYNKDSRGVKKRASGRRPWVAVIGINGIGTVIGSFATEAEAKEAYENKKAELMRSSESCPSVMVKQE